MLSGAGEMTCGNTRCEYHHPLPEYLQRSAGPTPSLTTLELPFAYEEHGENKSALVKIVLCKRCVDKLMWKRRQGKGKAVEDEVEEETETKGSALSAPMEDRQGKVARRAQTEKFDETEAGISREGRQSKHRDDRQKDNRAKRRRRSSRSQSPRMSYRRHSSPSNHYRESKRDHRQ